MGSFSVLRGFFADFAAARLLGRCIAGVFGPIRLLLLLLLFRLRALFRFPTISLFHSYSGLHVGMKGT